MHQSHTDQSTYERALDKMNEFIDNKKLRHTKQRELILKAIFNYNEHFSADILQRYLSKSGVKISRSTLYRTLLLLVEAKLLVEIKINDNNRIYDPNFLEKPAHNHLICIDCGRVEEFEDANLATLNDCVTKRLGFKAIKQSICIEATCEQLRIKGQCKNMILSRIKSEPILASK